MLSRRAENSLKRVVSFWGAAREQAFHARTGLPTVCITGAKVGWRARSMIRDFPRRQPAKCRA